MTEEVTPDPRRDTIMKLLDELVACDKVLDELAMRIRGLPMMGRDIRRKRMPELQELQKKWLATRAEKIVAIQEQQKDMPKPIVNFIEAPKNKGTIGTLSPRKS